MRVFFGLPARTLAATPERFFLVGLKGVGFMLLWQIAFFVVGVIAVVQLFGINDRILPFYLYMIPAVAVSQFLVGRSVAKRAPQDRISAWLALAILETLLNTAIALPEIQGWRVIPVCLGSLVWYQIPALAGVVLWRRNARVA